MASPSLFGLGNRDDLLRNYVLGRRQVLDQIVVVDAGQHRGVNAQSSFGFQNLKADIYATFTFCLVTVHGTSKKKYNVYTTNAFLDTI
jgi:hypothetical protein